MHHGGAALLRWSLSDWIELAKHSNAAALLERQADRYSVAALWQQFKVALVDRPDELAELLCAWVAAQGKGSGWASMAPSDAREWVRRLRVLMSGDAIPRVIQSPLPTDGYRGHAKPARTGNATNAVYT